MVVMGKSELSFWQRVFSITLCVGFFCSSIVAGDYRPFSSLRERLQINDGLNKKAYGDASIDAKGKRVGKSDDHLWMQRIMAGGRYETKDIVYSLIVYDARTWNSSIPKEAFIKNANTPQSYWMDPYREYFDLFDASVTFKHLAPHLRLKIGRQDIGLGDHRIIGPGTWGNAIGHLWDAARFIYSFKKGWLQLWYGQTRVRNPHKLSLLQKHLFEGSVAYGHLQSIGKGGLEPFLLYKHTLRPKVSLSSEKNAYLGYGGVRWYGKDYHGLNWDSTYTCEFGQNGGKEVRAYGYVLKIGYRFDKLPLKPNIVIGRVYASGDDNPNDGTLKTFSPPFGSTDGGHYGRMDIMKWSNLKDNQVNLHLSWKKIKAKLSYHDFWLANANDSWSYYGYRNKNGHHDTHLGGESDLELGYSPTKKLHLAFVCAHFDAGSFVRHNVASNDANRLFVQATYHF